MTKIIKLFHIVQSSVGLVIFYYNLDIIIVCINIFNLFFIIYIYTVKNKIQNKDRVQCPFLK